MRLLPLQGWADSLWPGAAGGLLAGSFGGGESPRPVERGTRAGSAAAVLRGSAIVAQIVFTPLVAAWSIWIGIAISARASDIRIARQIAIPVSLPSFAVALLVALNVIPATLLTAVLLAAALIGLNILGWRVSTALLDPERLITR